MYQRLFQVAQKMRKSKYGRGVYAFLEETGVRCLVSRVFNAIHNARDYKKPTKEMLESRAYFSERHEEIKSVTKLLADKQSKECLVKMIRFRCESNNWKLPPNSMRAEYFFNEFFDFQPGEVFVDCGAYDGDSIQGFKKRMKGKSIKKIVAFEPDEQAGVRLLEKYPEVQLVKGGVWNKRETLRFTNTGGVNAQITEAGTMIIQAYAIDELEECQDATFIKMDIEGSEQKAILGAKNVIQKNKPKLAICIYHSDEDMLKLPVMIHELVPEYKLYVRQHANSRYDTVLYAVCPEK